MFVKDLPINRIKSNPMGMLFSIFISNLKYFFKKVPKLPGFAQVFDFRFTNFWGWLKIPKKVSYLGIPN